MYLGAIHYVRMQLGGRGHPKCTQRHARGGGVSPPVYVRTNTISFQVLGSMFFLWCLVFFVKINEIKTNRRSNAYVYYMNDLLLVFIKQNY